MENTAVIVKADTQKKSVWLSNNQRLGFAQARRLGFDVESWIERNAAR